MLEKPTIVLRDDVPLPSLGKYPFKEMSIGQSFVFPQGITPNRAGSVAYMAGKRLNRKFVTRKTPRRHRLLARGVTWHATIARINERIDARRRQRRSARDLEARREQETLKQLRREIREMRKRRKAS